MRIRPIQDPTTGRGLSFELYVGDKTLSFSPTIGFSEKVFGLHLKVTPPFSVQNLNEGNKDYDNHFKTIELSVALLWVKVNLSFYFHPPFGF